MDIILSTPGVVPTYLSVIYINVLKNRPIFMLRALFLVSKSAF